MSQCHVSNQIAINADCPEEAECAECGSAMTISQEGGFEVLCCDNEECGHKVWADGDEY